MRGGKRERERERKRERERERERQPEVYIERDREPESQTERLQAENTPERHVIGAHACWASLPKQLHESEHTHAGSHHPSKLRESQ
jgi:hypothetical protein